MFFKSVRIKALEHRIMRLEAAVAEAGRATRDRIWEVEKDVLKQENTHLMYGIPVYDENGLTKDREVTVDVRDVVRQMADGLMFDIRWRKSGESHVVLHLDDD